MTQLRAEELELKMTEQTKPTMIPGANETTSRSTQKSSQDGASDILVFLAVCFAMTAIGLGWFGLDSLYNDSYERKVVGGDAYNFIIYATRGTAWVCSGIISALLGLICAVLSRAK